MRLYYFTPEKYGLMALRNRRLKIARIDALNDPFEFLAWNIQNRRFRARIRKWKASKNAALGLLCLSRDWRHPLLWGHYAEKHRGMALGFDVPDEGPFRPVQYRPTRMPFPEGRELSDDDFDEALLTKFCAWAYESEHRRVCQLSDCLLESGHYFERFSETLQLREVILGDLCTVKRAKLAGALGDQTSSVEAFKARPKFGGFEVGRNLNEKLWK